MNWLCRVEEDLKKTGCFHVVLTLETVVLFAESP